MTSKDYSKWKIYKIEPKIDHDEGDIYIGSTTKQYLSQRMTAHRKNYNSTWLKGNKQYKLTSYDIFDKYGVDNCEIILLETVKATSIDDLRAREKYYIKSIKCVNRNIPTRTIKEYVDDNKEKIKEQQLNWRLQNKDAIKEYQKVYNEENRDDIRQQKKEYRVQNKELLSANKKVYYDKNKEELNKLRREKYAKRVVNTECQCGSLYRSCDKARHENTKKHLTFITQQIKINI
jgi:hypothetical protein